MLYGCSPFADESAQALGLKPVMTLTSELIAVRDLRPGERVGYGGTFVADRADAARRRRLRLRRRLSAPRADRDADPGRTAIATRTVGPRLDGHAHRRSRSACPERRSERRSRSGATGLSCDEVAAAAGTVSYELLCALAARVPQIERA